MFNLAHIPDGVSDADAVCVTDTLTSGSSGPESARLPLGATVVILGQGHIGLAATMTARLLGARLVVTVKARPGGEATSLAVGADHALNLTEHDVEAEIARLTGGVGVDCAIEASGVLDSFPRAVAVTREGGTIVVLSSLAGDEDATLGIPLRHWGWGLADKTILGTFQRAGSERVTRLLGLVATGRLRPGALPSRTYDLSDIGAALEAVAKRDPDVVKPYLTFS